MAVGTVEFYSMPGSISSGEYPIFTENQDVSGYLVESVEKCKYTKDLLQAVGPIAIFDNYDTVNMAKINDEWYWVVDWTTQSLQKESVIFGLSYNAPTSQLRLGQSITGVFGKTPTMTRPYMTASITNDAMKASRHIDMPNMGSFIIGEEEPAKKLVWAEVTGISTSETNTIVKRYGFFATIDTVSMEPSGLVYSKVTSNDVRRYPTIREAIQEPEGCFDFQGDQIIQMSISERCPYAYGTAVIPYGPGDPYFRVQLIDGWTSQPRNWSVYSDTAGMPDTPAPASTVTLTLTDMERMCGSVRIVNESGSVIATIPNQYGNTITLNARCIGDYTGIYTELSYDGRLVATLNEGHLPWTGDAWREYQARQMESDRQMVGMANQLARADLSVNLQQSKMNEVFTQLNAVSSVGLFNPGSWVSSVLTVAEAGTRGYAERGAMSQRTMLEEMSNNMQQALTEKTIMAEPGTAYSMGYGTIYCKNTILHPARLQLEMPANLTNQYFADFMAEYGYPSEGKQTLTLSPGFIQGQILNNGTLTGRKFDELSRNIQSGIKMRSVT